MKLIVQYFIGLAFFFVVFIVGIAPAQAAQVTIDSSVNTTAVLHNGSSPTTVFTSDQVGYTFYIDSNGTAVYSKTTDGGTTWGGAVTVDSQTDAMKVAIWYDQWTPGDTTGTYIHIVTIDSGNDDLWYNRLDTSSDTLQLGSSPVDITDASSTNHTNTLTTNTNIPSITKATDGVIYIGIHDVGTTGDESYVIKCSSSCNTAGNWSDTGSTTSVLGAHNDYLILMPLASANILAIRYHSNQIQSNVYTAGSDSWAHPDGSWTVVDSSSTGASDPYDGFLGATVNLNTNDIYLAYVSNIATTNTNDIRTATYDGSSWTGTTDVLTNSPYDITGAKIAYDSGSGDIYVVYSAQTTPADATTASVFYKKSTDTMSTWGTEQGPLNTTTSNGDIYGARINILSNERLYATWVDTGVSDLYGALVIDIISGATQVVFTNATRTLTAGVCNGAGSVLTMQTQNASNIATSPSQSTVVRITSTSPDYTIYSDSSCSSSVANGDFTFTTAQNTKSVYIIDRRKSSSTWTLTAARQSGDILTSGTQTITVNAGTVSRLMITLPGQSFTDGTGNSGSVTAQTAGSSFNIVKISATDGFNNVNTSYSGSKTLSYSGPGNAPSGTSPTYTTTVSFTSGQSTTTLATSLFKAETTTISVTEVSHSYGLASSSLTVNPGALNNYSISVTTPQTAGTCFTGTNTVTARDQWNNTRTSDTSTVNMTTSGTSITFYSVSNCTSTVTQYTLSSGTATIYIKTPKKQSGITITATKNASTETGTSASITVDPGTVSTILVKLPGQSFTDGTGISGSINFTGLRTPNATADTSFSIDLKAVDANNNLVDSGTNNYNGSKTLDFSNSTAGNSPAGTSPTFPSTTQMFTNGSVTGLSVTYPNAATLRTVRADDSGNSITGTASSTFTVQAGAVNSYAVTATTPQTAGVAFNVTITAQDAEQNPLGSLYSAPAGSYSWSTTAHNAPDNTAPSIGTLSQGNFSNGVATKSVTLYDSEGRVTFTASEPSPSTVTGLSSFAILINAGTVSSLATNSTVTGSSTVAINTAEVLTITLKDSWQNPVSAIAGNTITFTGTTATFSIVSSPTTTDSNGVSSAALSWSDVGSKTVTVSVSSASPSTTLASTLNVTVSAPPSQIQFQGGMTIRGGVTFSH